MTVGDSLIVLHTTAFSENSLVVHTLSREYGRRSFLVRKPRMSLFLPLNILEAEIVESSKSKLFLARSFAAEHPLNGIRNNIYKNSITLFLSEVLFKTIKEEGREEGLFEWCRSSILLLDALESDFSNFHLWFLLELARQLGFAPESSDFAPSEPHVAPLRSGAAHLENEGSGLLPFVNSHFAEVRSLLTLPFEEAMLIPMSGPVRNEIAESLLRYIEYHIESSININSLRVLRELFS